MSVPEGQPHVLTVRASPAVVPVAAAVRVVAAGLFKRRDGRGLQTMARVTLTLTPVAGHGKSALDLLRWPSHLEALVGKGVAIDVRPLGADGGRGSSPPKTTPVLFRRAKAPSTSSELVDSYWRSVMGGDAGLANLRKAFGAGASILQSLVRPAAAGGGSTPNIHGTDRGVAAVEYTLTRAREILGRLTGTAPVEDTTRADAALSEETMRLLALDRPEPLPGTEWSDADRVALYLEAQDRALDRRAWQALEANRGQADAAARARRAYLRAATPKEALEALRGGRELDCRPVPHAAALTHATGPVGADATRPAKAAVRLSTRIDRGVGSSKAPPGPVPSDDPTAPDPATASALRRLYALQAHPSLARLFRMTVDLECSLAELEAALGNVGATSDPQAAGAAEVGVLDHDEPLADGPAPPSRLPAAGTAVPRFLLLSAVAVGTPEGRPLPAIWSTAKFRSPGAGEREVGHFYPCTREEVDAFAAGKGDELRAMALAEQVDGIVDLGQSAPCPAGREPRFDVVTLDAITSIASDAADEIAAAHYTDRTDESITRGRGTLRTGGLGLVDRWRQEHAIARFLASQRQHDQRSGGTEAGAVTDAFKGGLLLDASDLTVGYKLDVGVKSRRDPKDARRRWHTLMRRKVTFVPGRDWPSVASLEAAIDELYPDGRARLRADDGLLNVPAALRSPSGEEATASAFAEEIVGTWRGDPLGLAPGRSEQSLDTEDVGIGMAMDLPTRGDGLDYTPPPLRFGWRYHFALRATFAGGVAIPLERALGHYERSHGGQLALPRTSAEGRAFRRHERIDAPSVAIPDWCFGSPAASGERGGRLAVDLRGAWATPQSERMIVRTLEDAANATILAAADWLRGPPGSAAEAGLSRRVLLPPAVALDFAGLHGALDHAELERDVVLHQARVLGASEPAGPDEGTDEEWVTQREPVAKGSSEMRRVWRTRSVAWREVKVRSRPRGGLEGVDYDAAWGGLPVFRMLKAEVVDDPRLRRSGDLAPPQPDEQTDAGEIVAHLEPRKVRIAGRAVTVTRRVVEDTPSGPAVFRKRRAPDGRARSKPFYPDPGAGHMVIVVEVEGGADDGVSVPLYRTEQDAPVPIGYPDVLPIVLDVVRDDTGPGAPRKLIEVVGGARDGLRAYGDEAVLRRGGEGRGGITVRQVVIRLRPGERASIRAWCLPGSTFLDRMFEPVESAAALCAACGCTDPLTLRDPVVADAACRKGFLSLTGIHLGPPEPAGEGAPTGVGGLHLPTQAAIDAVARSIRSFMVRKSIPEIAAVLDIEATHAVDLPQTAPAYRPPVSAPGRLPFLRVPPEGLAAILTPKPISEVPPVAPDGGCTVVEGPDLGDSGTWTSEVQAPGAVGFLLDGVVSLHGPSTGAIEIQVTGPAAAHGRFDDPERGRTRDDQARGLWPRPDGRTPADPLHIFGFAVAANGRVTLRDETVTVLRVDGFGSGDRELALLDLQRASFERNDAGLLRATRPAAIPDACARFVRLHTVAIARHGGLLRTRADILPVRLSRREEAPLAGAREGPATPAGALGTGSWLPATVRPARVAGISLIPSFAWTTLPVTTRKGVPAVLVQRVPLLRVRMRRPWFSSGQGERLGIVVWPPNLFRLDPEDVRQDVLREFAPGATAIDLRTLPDDGSGEMGGGDAGTGTWEFRDADVGPGGAWVSRWGMDPIRNGDPVPGWLLSKDNFHGSVVATAADWAKPPAEAPADGAVAEHVLVPIPTGEDLPESRAAEPAGGFMSAALVTYEARFDPEQEHWYADVALDPLTADSPFVRLGLVRFQPHAPRALMVSEPIVEWAQVLPKRTATAWISASGGTGLIDVEVRGVAARRGDGPGDPKTSPAQRALVRIKLLRRITRNGEDLGEVVVAEAEGRVGSDGAETTWTTPEPFGVPASALRDAETTWSVYVEEVDRLRPGTYPDEPRFGSTMDAVFVETGPRFAAKLGLAACLEAYRARFWK